MKTFKLLLLFLSILGIAIGVVWLLNGPHSTPLLERIPAFRCSYAECNKTFRTVSELQTHISTAHLTFDCNDCTAEFDTNEELEKHINDVHLTHKCDKCQERFATAEELNKHKTEKHPIVPGKPHKCLTPGCRKSFATEDELFEHTKTVHKKYACKICGQDMCFLTQTELDAHIRSWHGINER